MTRLNAKNIDNLPADIQKPQYDFANLKAGIVHIGVGAFHRAHQAVYTDAVLNRFGGDWRIIGVDFRSGRACEQLNPQNGIYSVVARGGEVEDVRVIGSIANVLGPESASNIIDVMSDESIKIISMTITEKGYCHDPATGNLNLDNSAIQHDIKNIHAPKTAIGFIVASLKSRMENNVRSPTLLSCDNLPGNGNVLRKAVLGLAQAVDPALAQWVEKNTAFPNTMVDRIAPATTDVDKSRLEKRLGVRDEAMVVTEPFTQWVIEDDFCNSRPRWEDVGALIVNDVGVYEYMKLRLLNGSHSLLAYLGYLAGFETVSDAMSDSSFYNLCKTFMAREAGETLQPPAGFNLESYKQQLLDRFANPGLKHRTWQIAMDGSQKIPQRWLNTLRDQLKSNGNIDIICLGIAAWIRYVSGVDESGKTIEVKDPLATELVSLSAQYKNSPRDLVPAILALDAVFGEDIKNQTSVVTAVSDWLERLYQQGALAVVRMHF